MGALFSSEPEYPRYVYREEQYSRPASIDKASYYSSSSITTTGRPSTLHYSSNTSSVCPSHYSSSTNSVRPSASYPVNNNVSPTYATVNSARTIRSNADFKRFQQIMYSALIRQSRSLNWTLDATVVEYQKVRLDTSTNEYTRIFNKFMRGITHDENHNVQVIKIERVENPYLMGQYSLKKLEYQNKSLPLEERILFHGTKTQYIDNICKNNFDWRYHGRTKGNKFGKGVSFAPRSPYANHYCDRNNKIMIVAKVLVSKACPGNEYMDIPNYYNKSKLLRFDTSIKEPKKDVVVKYCDDEFYPAYLVHYTGKMFYHNKRFYR